MSKCREEASGVYRVALYRPRSSRAVVEWARSAEGWTEAVVNEQAADGTTRGVVDEEYRAASVLHPPAGSRVRREFDVLMATTVMPLVRRVWGKTLSRHAGTQLVRYSPGGHYDLHSDVGPSTRSRHFSVVCYLNEDFEGGRTAFPQLNYCAQPAAGTALVFPSTYSHRAEPVISGEKFVIVSWVLGPAD